jgi:hypothetical protein
MEISTKECSLADGMEMNRQIPGGIRILPLLQLLLDLHPVSQWGRIKD